MSVYADTSFLLSLYVLDSNSQTAAERIRKARLPILLTAFGEVELANAISLRLFRREIAPLEAKQARAAVRQDLANRVLLSTPLANQIFGTAIQIARRRTPNLGTRTLDILHVAAAMELKTEKFFTFDRKQEELARLEGLVVGSS